MQFQVLVFLFVTCDDLTCWQHPLMVRCLAGCCFHKMVACSAEIESFSDPDQGGRGQKFFSTVTLSPNPWESVFYSTELFILRFVIALWALTNVLLSGFRLRQLRRSQGSLTAAQVCILAQCVGNLMCAMHIVDVAGSSLALPAQLVWIMMSSPHSFNLATVCLMTIMLR